MVDGPVDPELVAVLHESQRLGFLGARPISAVIAHARGFVRALDEFESVETILDLGSGGGVPGLVIAHDRPSVHLTLLDRRAKRTDFLERVVRRLRWQDRVDVVCQDVNAFGPDHSFDAVVARGFGPPAFTLAAAARLVRPGSPMMISEPPDENRWDEQLLDRLHVERCEFPRHEEGATGSPLDGLVAVFRSR